MNDAKLPDLDTRIILKYETAVESICFLAAQDGHATTLVVTCRDNNYLLYYPLPDSLRNDEELQLVKYNMNANNDDWVSFTVLHLSPAPNGRFLLANTSTPTGKLLIFPAHSGTVLKTFYGVPTESLAPRCTWSADGKYVLATGDDFAIWCFKVNTGELISRITHHEATVRNLWLDPSLGILSCGWDKNVFVYGV